MRESIDLPPIPERKPAPKAQDDSSTLAIETKEDFLEDTYDFQENRRNFVSSVTEASSKKHAKLQLFSLDDSDNNEDA